jgi:hypothetical protein
MDLFLDRLASRLAVRLLEEGCFMGVRGLKEIGVEQTRDRASVRLDVEYKREGKRTLAMEVADPSMVATILEAPQVDAAGTVGCDFVWTVDDVAGRMWPTWDVLHVFGHASAAISSSEVLGQEVGSRRVLQRVELPPDVAVELRLSLGYVAEIPEELVSEILEPLTTGVESV